jgi:hypothetical protein
VVPLAFSGITVIGTAVSGATLLLIILLRIEARDAAAEEDRPAEERAPLVNDDGPFA